jgi:hypothetical protein
MEWLVFILNTIKAQQVIHQEKRIHLRDFEYLKIYLYQFPKTAQEKKRIKKMKNWQKIFFQFAKQNMYRKI